MNQHVANLVVIRDLGEKRYKDIRKKRSQQYSDECRLNTTARKGASQSLHYFHELASRIAEDIAEAKADYDLTRIDHPGHGQLGWQACYIDHCSIHYEAKASMQTWPRICIPVIVNRGWTSEGYQVPDPEWTKN
jgi:hypothetical protein